MGWLPPAAAEKTAPTLVAALGDLTKAMRLLGGEPSALQNRLQECRRRVEAAWLQAHGIVLEVLAAKPEVSAGASIEVEAELLVRGNTMSFCRPCRRARGQAGRWSPWRLRFSR